MVWVGICQAADTQQMNATGIIHDRQRPRLHSWLWGCLHALLRQQFWRHFVVARATEAPRKVCGGSLR
jgi:hypothetical protein